MTDKKPTKPVSKTLKKSTSKKPAQKTFKMVKSSKQSENIPFLSNLLSPNIEPPDGFREISASQAIMEYAGPLMEMVPEPEDIVKANQIFQIATTIWNYTLDDSVKKKDKTSKAEILALIIKDVFCFDRSRTITSWETTSGRIVHTSRSLSSATVTFKTKYNCQKNRVFGKKFL